MNFFTFSIISSLAKFGNSFLSLLNVQKMSSFSSCSLANVWFLGGSSGGKGGLGLGGKGGLGPGCKGGLGFGGKGGLGVNSFFRLLPNLKKSLY